MRTIKINLTPREFDINGFPSTNPRNKEKEVKRYVKIWSTGKILIEPDVKEMKLNDYRPMYILAQCHAFNKNSNNKA